MKSEKAIQARHTRRAKDPDDEPAVDAATGANARPRYCAAEMSADRSRRRKKQLELTVGDAGGAQEKVDDSDDAVDGEPKVGLILAFVKVTHGADVAAGDRVQVLADEDGEVKPALNRLAHGRGDKGVDALLRVKRAGPVPQGERDGCA